MGFRYRYSVFNKAPDMHFVSLHASVLLVSSVCFSCGNASRQIRRICKNSFFSFFKLRSGTCALISFLYFFACLKILFIVPGARSSDGCPARVILPGFTGCLYFCCYEVPSIGFDDFNNVPDFQEDTSDTA